MLALLYNSLLELQVSTVLRYAHANNIEAFLEPAVDLCLALLRRDAHDMEARAPGAGFSVALADNVESFVMFCGLQGLHMAEAAAECAVLLSEVRIILCCCACACSTACRAHEHMPVTVRIKAQPCCCMAAACECV